MLFIKSITFKYSRSNIHGTLIHKCCVPPGEYLLVGERLKEEALLTSYSSRANPLDMSWLDQAWQEMRDQVGIEKGSLIGN